MSGGSFNYCFRRTAVELIEDSGELASLETALERFGAESEAVRALTRDIEEDVARLRMELARLDEKIDRARNVWQQMEYRCSNDCGDAVVHQALEQFNKPI